jgi:glycoprotein endo-alpha-1,2-mannosidase
MENQKKLQRVWLLLMVFGLTCIWADADEMIKTEQLMNESSNSAVVKPYVGVYYYPWYKGPEDQWKQAMRLHLETPQKPKSGLYDSRDPKVIADHIEQSLRGGVSFWSVSWWGPGSFTDQVFKEDILKHPDASKLKHAILYESTGRFGRFANPDFRHWMGDLEYLKKTYFNDPRYLKIDNRPVIFVYLSRVYFRNQGADALRQMREQFPDIYLVGDDVFYGDGSDRYDAAWAKNFDAVTAYDVYGQSVKALGGTHKAIEFLARNYHQARQAANSVGTAFMPAIAPGYNDTAVRKGHPGRARYFTDTDNSREGDIFRAMIRRAALPNLDVSCNNIMMVTSFNEWYEDSQIEPTEGTCPPSSTDDSESGTYFTGGQVYNDYGYLYLDILKEETRVQ